MAANDAKRGPGKVESISFHPKKGGVVSETHKTYPRGGQGGGGLHDYETEGQIHPTLEHAQAHLAKTMGGCFTKSED